MTTPLPLKDCYERRVRDFREHFAHALKSRSTGSVHEMRVALKRLRAFFNLAGSIDPGFKSEEAFAPARRLFRAAGDLRNLHVVEAKVRETSVPGGLELSEYYNWLKEREKREARRFVRACRRLGKGFFTSAWRSMPFAQENPVARRARKRAEDRLFGLIREIKDERSPRPGVRRLHFLRTRTKEARYILEIIQECGLAGDDGPLLNDRLRDVHQALGRWHDEEVVLKSLREFRKRRAPGPLLSFKSYLEFSRLAKTRKADELAVFGEAWAALLEFLGRGVGRGILRPPSAGALQERAVANMDRQD